MSWLADIFKGWRCFAPPNTKRPGRKAFYARRRNRRRRRRALLRMARAALLLLVCGNATACEEHEPRPCERLQHHTTTGQVVLCDCSCSDDPRFACPPNVCDHADLEDDDWRWPEESSSDA